MSEKVIDGLSGYVEEVCLLRKTLRHAAPVCYDELLFRGHSNKTHRIIPFWVEIGIRNAVTPYLIMNIT